MSNNGSISLNDILVRIEMSAEDLDFIENQNAITDEELIESDSMTNPDEANDDSNEAEDSLRSIGKESISLLRRYDGEISELRERLESARHEKNNWLKTVIPSLTALLAISCLVMVSLKPHKSAVTARALHNHAQTVPMKKEARM